jgi:hypothetical protein
MHASANPEYVRTARLNSIAWEQYDVVVALTIYGNCGETILDGETLTASLFVAIKQQRDWRQSTPASHQYENEAGRKHVIIASGPSTPRVAVQRIN